MHDIILKGLLQIHNNKQFTNKIEAVQCNSALAITGCIGGTSREKLYSELGLESLSEHRLFHRLMFFYKIINGLAPAYLKNFVLGVILNLHNVRGHRDEWIHTRTLKYRYSFFPHEDVCCCYYEDVNEATCHIGILHLNNSLLGIYIATIYLPYTRQHFLDYLIFNICKLHVFVF